MCDTIRFVVMSMVSVWFMCSAMPSCSGLYSAVKLSGVPRILATTIRTPHSDDGGIDDIEDGPELQDYTP